VELKDPKGVLSARQQYVISQLDQLGVKVYVLCSTEQVDGFIKEVIMVKNG
jgi:ABC-type hemin transport system substrate-binding protein